MPTLVMAGKAPHKIADGALKKKAWTFLEKLQEDDTTAGLHIEPINGSIDPRVRTGRVDEFWRAVLFKLTGQGDTHYVFHGIWAHDDAIAVAKKVTLKQNPINGMPVIEEIAVPEPAPTPARTSQTRGADTAPVPPREVEKAPAADGPHAPCLPALGYSHDDLVQRLGLPDALADAALAVDSEDDLLALAEQHEGWIGLVLVDLGAGESVESIIERLDLKPEPTTGDADEDLVRALRRPAARTAFAFIEGQEELRRVIEADDFEAWRVFLHPEQRRYVDQRTNGPFRVSGGAGTGKTVVLVHRARALAARDPHARIVLTTYTTNLADALRDQVRRLDPAAPLVELGAPGIHVTGVDALASAVVRRAPGPALDAAQTAVLGEARSHPNQRTPQARWRTVLDHVTTTLPPTVANESFLQDEYDLVVLPAAVRTLEEYLRVRRTGRGVALDRSARTEVWRLLQEYRTEARHDGSLDFAEAGVVAAAYLEGAPGHAGERLADHVLVDEGQDLTPAHWKLLRALAPAGPDDLFIAEDSHQRIYGHRTPLKRLGVNIVGRSRRLTLNYRTTAQNLRWALAQLDGVEWVDLEGETEQTGYRSARSGPSPEVFHAPTLGEELEVVVERVRGWLDTTDDPSTIAVLVPDRQQRDRVAQALTDGHVPAVAVDRERPPARKVAVMTRHRAKGTEFSRVVLTDVGWTAPWEAQRLAAMEESERRDAEQRLRSVLYVAATRARDELVIVRR
ncbi:UvrD-helicase domain-containing protein [Cellulomonas sp. 179-A 9B4 NHS]|uniref:UvrD-helicase domain-containing protein n=1 Tax=Cellulomonas sp. 179-A 9B4 NHS TaxID=3142379 RepID=UPI0039A29855